MLGIISGAAAKLQAGGMLFLYGPFAVSGRLEPESNVKFDETLRSKNPSWGVRDITEIEKVRG